MNQDTTRWEHGLEHAFLSDVGLRRPVNQDCLAVMIADSEKTWRQQGHVFVVADGMGAHAAGELAAKLAVDNVCLTYAKLGHRQPHEALRDAILDANTKIHTRGQGSEDFRGMGTTVSTLVLLPQGALVGHVGDSRIYRLREHVLEQLTFDHSLVWEVCAAEGISEDEAPSYIPRNVITRSAGPNASVEVDLEGLFPLQLGDTFLITSDGLSGLVRDRELGTILACLPPDEAIKTLVDLAILRGGPDNITGLVVRVTGPAAIGHGDSVDAGPGGRRCRGTAFWVTLAILLLASIGLVGLALWAHPMVALAGLVCVLTVGLLALMVRHGDDPPVAPLDRQSLGKAPYTKTDCRPNALFVVHLAQLLEELRTTADERNWTVDWEHVQGFLDRASAAADDEDHPRAIREYCRALSFITDQLREQPGETATGGDSAWVEESG